MAVADGRIRDGEVRVEVVDAAARRLPSDGAPRVAVSWRGGAARRRGSGGGVGEGAARRQQLSRRDYIYGCPRE